MSRLDSLSLAELEARHAAEVDRERRVHIRRAARQRAQADGAEPPAWAARLPPGRNASPYPDIPAQPIPEELRAWRARGEGRAVSIGRGGCGLHSLGEPTRWFASVDEAIAAVRA